MSASGNIQIQQHRQSLKLQIALAETSFHQNFPLASLVTSSQKSVLLSLLTIFQDQASPHADVMRGDQYLLSHKSSKVYRTKLLWRQ